MKAFKAIAVSAVICCAGIIAVRAQAANETLIQQGKTAFQRDDCAACHGAETVAGGRHLPGTEALIVKYKGKEPGPLAERKDLAPAYIRYIVRHGVSVMPFFRPTMLSHADLDAIIAYLTRNNPKDSHSSRND